jgi:hypothetical protein
MMKIKTRSVVGSLTIGSIATLALAFSPIQQAQAATITSLYNTGVDGSGVVLADGTLGDAHYTLTPPGAVGAGNTNVVRVRQTVGGYPIPPWVGDDTISAWIGPNNATNLSSNGGLYDYQTTFDLTGFDYTTASISGQWAADDNIKILLNGNEVLPLTTGAHYSNWTSLASISSGFQAGINTLDFIVNNDGGGPTGLRTELIGTANLAATTVPEPSDLMGTTIAFGSAVLLKRKLTKKNIG